MKIAYSIGSIYKTGGTERVLCTKANYLADHLGYEVHIIVLNNNTPPFFPFSAQIHIHSLGIEQLNHKHWMIFGSRSKKEYKEKLFRKLEEIRPDITLSLFGPDAEFLYRAKDGSRKVLEFHFTKNYLKYLGEKNAMPGDKFRLLRKLWLSFLIRRQAHYASNYKNIVLLTERDKKLWGGGSKFRIIPNPLSFVSKKGYALKSKQVIAIGSYIPQKGFDLLIDSFARIAAEFPDWELYIYGKGQDKDFLAGKINDLCLQNQIFLKDPAKNIGEKLQDSAIFALSSRYEGFGLVLTEAMECGLPCVAFDCECGPDEIITPGRTGTLVPQQNTVLFAEALKELMKDEDKRKQMGYKAKEEVKRFYPENIMPLWIKLFEEIILNED